ncbi:hypothetical protein [Phytomonospora endophytica]|uniref:Uncharacterized protein n=1 Tax=Phytomonospora endophytica TaxID=714109 RepID=A0A841FUB3_9ACTN|nr:hypothetical protein [Phytomonospora endophytica]MBB6039596.1 hypothetical protein [Phytomonospora endophytica]GIG65687.1 hypothetical protein Pen01_19820 [Phytomonospora endophytica]
MDDTVRTFVELVKQKQHRIVMDVAAANLGSPLPDIQAALRVRLVGTGASDAEIAAWAEMIHSTARAPHLDDADRRS